MFRYSWWRANNQAPGLYSLLPIEHMFLCHYQPRTFSSRPPYWPIVFSGERHPLCPWDEEVVQQVDGTSFLIYVSRPSSISLLTVLSMFDQPQQHPDSLWLRVPNPWSLEATENTLAVGERAIKFCSRPASISPCSNP